MQPLSVSLRLTVDEETLIKRVGEACASGLPDATPESGAGKSIAIVCPGPSIKKTWWEALKFEEVWAVNAAHDFLLSKNVKPTHGFVMCPGDTIAEYMKEPQSGVVYYVASQTNPVILGRMKGRAVFLFHAYQHGYAGLMQEFGRLGKLPLVHGGGSHAGLRAIYFARLIRGITDIHVFGLDASFADGEHHAGEQFLLDSCEIECEGRTFRSLPSYADQVNQMVALVKFLPDVKITFYGDGLMQWAFRGKENGSDSTLRPGHRQPEQAVEAE